MKQLIRKNTFETNSSSMHSIVLSKDSSYYTEEEIERDFSWILQDGTIDLTDGDRLEFGGSPFRVLSTYFEKLCYYLASKHYTWTDDDYQQFLNQIIELHSFIQGFTFSENEYYKDEDDLKYNYGTVDHQSSDVLSDFLLESGVGVEDFLKSKEYVVIIDGDEYCVFNSYDQCNLITSKREKDEEVKNPELQECFKNMEIGYHYSGFDDTCIIQLDRDNYTEDELNEYVYIRDDKLNIYLSNGYAECLYRPIDKFEWFYKLYTGNPVKLDELDNLAIKYWKCKEVKSNSYCYEELRIKVSDYTLVDNYLKETDRTFEDIIFKKQFVICLNGQLLAEFARCKILDYSKIIDITNHEEFY